MYSTLISLLILFSSFAADQGQEKTKQKKKNQKINISIKNQKGNLVDGAVVFLEGIAPAKKRKKITKKEVVQINRSFVPNILIVNKGEKVFFPNKDETSHNVYSISENKKFSVGLHKKDSTPNVTFDKQGPVVLGCNIHDWMIGFIYVVDSDFHGIAQDGQIQFKLPPTQNFRIGVWHPKIRRRKTKYFKINPENLKSHMEFKVSLKK